MKIKLNSSRILQKQAEFMQAHDLFAPSGRALVAASCGVDSFCLLKILNEHLKKRLLNEIIVLHVNHQLRKESEEEEKILFDWCQGQGVKFLSTRWQFHEGMGQSNLESRAREFRYTFFQSQIQDPGDRIYTAHHLNDSLEWSLMNSFKSSEVISSLGIPIRNQKICRPLMCFSKERLYELAHFWRLPYREDRSNSNLKFERNYWRQKILSPLLKEYPQALKHYVHRQNHLSKMLGVHVGDRTQRKIKKIRHWGRDLFGSRILFLDFQSKILSQVENANILPSLREEILSEIKLLALDKKRGRYQGQLNKLMQAWANKQEGPLQFSARVEVYLVKNMLAVMGASQREFYRQLDRQLYLKLEEIKPCNNAQIPGVACSVSETKKRVAQGRSYFPFILILPQALSLDHGRKRPHSLLPLSTKWLLDQGIGFQMASSLLYRKNTSTYLKDSHLDLQFLEDILT